MKLKKSFVFIAIIIFLLFAVQSSGEQTKFNDGFFISKPIDGTQRYPVVAFAKGVYMVVWQEGHYGFGSPADIQIRGVRIFGNGEIIDNESFIISNANDFQEMPAVASDGELFLVVWQDMRNGKDYDIYASRVTAKGTVLDPDGIAISKDKGNQCNPAISYDGKNFVIVWMDNREVEQSYHIRAARVSKDGVVFEIDGVTIAGYEGKDLESSLHSDNLRGIPLNFNPKIGCNDGNCLIGWIQKNQIWKASPRFKYISTEPNVHFSNEEISIPTGDVLKYDRAKNPVISVAVNKDKYMAVYSGIQGKGGGNYFILGVSFNNVNKSQDAQNILNIRLWEKGYKLSESIAPFTKNGFITVWAEGIYEWGEEAVKFSLKGGIIDEKNKIRIVEIIPWSYLYRGYPSISLGSENGLLVYEEINEKSGMCIVGRIFKKTK